MPAWQQFPRVRQLLNCMQRADEAVDGTPPLAAEHYLQMFWLPGRGARPAFDSEPDAFQRLRMIMIHFKLIISMDTRFGSRDAQVSLGWVTARHRKKHASSVQLVVTGKAFWENGKFQ